jgi:demethylmenaquinone methyltransferase / 2-methoxy-6-polyprenyl-1,4-benzoquinol methylase
VVAALTPVSPHPPLQQFYSDAADRERFVKDLFDGSAPWYDWAIAFLSFGSGRWYRRQVLRRAGLKKGDRVLDVATGTGVVAREAIPVARSVVGLDPSIGMLLAGREKAKIANVQGMSERLPFRNQTFDLITIGFALRHFADLDRVFSECTRVLRPNGRLLILEITAPESRMRRAILAAYMGGIVPATAAVLTRRVRVAKLLRYYWATTRDCVRPDVILDAMRGAGFINAQRNVSLGIFSEYSAVTPPRPLAAVSRAAGRSESAGIRGATAPAPAESD